jgi:hypothetical protein
LGKRESQKSGKTQTSLFKTRAPETLMKKYLHQGVKRLHLQIHPLFIKIRLGAVEKGTVPFFTLLLDGREERRKRR